jgi:hypothetical protein
LIEHWRAEVAKYEALEGVPLSQSEIDTARTEFIEKVEQREAVKFEQG